MRPSPALARLLPALLCALCAFLMAPATTGTGAGIEVPTAAAAAPSAPDPQLTGAEAAELPAVVEQSVRFPVPPVAPPVVRTADVIPVPGRVAGDPRRERAPPGLPYDPRDPRGPPSTRHR
ncbi:hypothetical protein [Streptomyces roseolus]|uniref:hypothetical protein n=1 Tax=Streptomyces roseolus TaxID=67358 RepID=UPI001679832A|nr:hypothetical protein [Streptomyces roseolus]GGR27342.1 hypothetical protein GCM10010282_19760 [Streptomyces roseolus]